MSTFYLTPRDLGLPPPLAPLHHAFLSHRQQDAATIRMLEAEKAGGRYASSSQTRGEGGRESTARPRSPLTQPLRNRQLPASFWQEPNVPRGCPGYPVLPYPLHLTHAWAADPASGPTSSTGHANDGSSSCGGGGGGGGGGGKQAGHVHKEFLERLQSAQVRGYDLAASRFPIAEFLFYNYGLRSYLDPSSAGAEPPPSSLALAGHAQRLPGPSPARSGVRSGDGVTGKAMGPKFSAAGHRAQGSLLRVGGGANGNAGLGFPTLCPYLGYNCPNLRSASPHRFWDCVLGQAAAASSLSSSSSVCDGVGGLSVGQLWKPVGDRTASVYPARYHPFANA